MSLIRIYVDHSELEREEYVFAAITNHDLTTGVRLQSWSPQSRATKRHKWRDKSFYSRWESGRQPSTPPPFNFEVAEQAIAEARQRLVYGIRIVGHWTEVLRSSD